MTLRKSQRSPEDVLFELIGNRYPGNAEQVAQRLDMSVKTLYKKLSTSLTLTEFSHIVHMLEGAGIDCSEAINALNFRHDRITIPMGAIDDTTDEDLRKNGLQAFRELSDFTGGLEEALERGEIGDKEMEALEPKKRKLLATMHLWWGRVKARHAARKEKRIARKENAEA